MRRGSRLRDEGQEGDWQVVADKAAEGPSAIADEPATVAALKNYLERALACGALDARDLEAAGLPRDFGAPPG